MLVRLGAVTAGGGRFGLGGAVTAGAAVRTLLHLGARNGQEGDGGKHERKKAGHSIGWNPQAYLLE